MNNIQQVLAFASAARQLSFAKAARELGVTPSSVAKSINRLESQLRVKLFHRTTRQVSLTPEGRDLFAHCERILEEVEALKSVAAGASGTPTGTLRIDMPTTFGKRVVLPILTRLLERYPDMSIDARFSDHRTDVIRDGLDAVVRIGPLEDSRLVAKPFARQQLIVCASPVYLARHGAPAAPRELEKHQCLSFRMPSSGRDRPWQFRIDGKHADMHLTSRLRLGDGEVIVAAAVAGVGLAQVPDYMAMDAMRAGHLKEVLKDFRPAPLPISVVYPGSRMVPARVRVLIEALTGAL